MASPWLPLGQVPAQDQPAPRRQRRGAFGGRAARTPGRRGVSWLGKPRKNLWKTVEHLWKTVENLWNSRVIMVLPLEIPWPSRETQSNFKTDPQKWAFGSVMAVMVCTFYQEVTMEPRKHHKTKGEGDGFDMIWWSWGDEWVWRCHLVMSTKRKLPTWSSWWSGLLFLTGHAWWCLVMVDDDGRWWWWFDDVSMGVDGDWWGLMVIDSWCRLMVLVIDADCDGKLLWGWWLIPDGHAQSDRENKYNCRSLYMKSYEI